MLDGASSHLGLFLHLTMRCNLKCAYCYGQTRRKDTMTFDVARDAVQLFLARTKCVFRPS